MTDPYESAINISDHPITALVMRNNATPFMRIANGYEIEIRLDSSVDDDEKLSLDRNTRYGIWCRQIPSSCPDPDDYDADKGWYRESGLNNEALAYFQFLSLAIVLSNRPTKQGEQS